MFQALASLVEKSPLSLTITAQEGGLMTVVVIPQGTDKAAQGLSTPLSLTGTPAELDAEFAKLIGSYTATRLSLAEQLAAAETVMKAAGKDATTKAAKASQQKPSTPVTAAPSSTDTSEEEAGEQEPVVVPGPTNPAKDDVLGGLF
ncbi:PRTRC system protein E [Crenobacter sp. SG2305]|uniref:PRTRC system protein E n=1 Tax=Crenobacter oryzisoli TaxID=3056844 RepID=UPI0025AA5962|nr:PRTRC system protein E [Crenobacter sp. SG2305]MDN0082352.1 PRTRC system protein E [Crenobacter sp. SG2305]